VDASQNGAHSLMTSKEPVSHFQRFGILTVFCFAPSGALQPVIQAANESGEYSFDVQVDNLQVHSIPSTNADFRYLVDVDVNELIYGEPH
jgi:hypothetical protein